MDFRVKLGRRSHGGLWIDLLPGPYKSAESFDQAIRVHEDAFWFLEPAIKNHCALYARPYSHYGVTVVLRDEWAHILREWADLARNLATAVLPIDLHVLRQVPRYARRRILRSFVRNQRKLAFLIGELIAWVLAALERHEEISILGI